jgi:c-di-GMP-binding flagellar brake protein YcgR
MNMDKDRRRFRRFDIALEVAVITSKYIGELFAGRTINFSRSGLCFESSDIAPVLNDPVELKVKLPDQDNFATVTGNVAWKKQLDNKCLIGVEFREIDREDKIQILDFAYDSWVEKNKEITSA